MQDQYSGHYDVTYFKSSNLLFIEQRIMYIKTGMPERDNIASPLLG